MRFPVQVTSVSAEGAGLALLAPAGTSLGSSRELVQVRLELGGGVTMPAQVVRFRSTSDCSGLYEVGLRLRPELAPASTRVTYGAWVADKLQALAERSEQPALELLPAPAPSERAADVEAAGAGDDLDVEIEVTRSGIEVEGAHAACG